MTIEYKGNDKTVKCYKDFVENPSDRTALRLFKKTFGCLDCSAKKLHDRLVSFATAGAYNAVYGSTKNRIEIKHGCADKDPLVLKVRIDDSYRKFFHNLLDETNVLLKKNWGGDFNTVDRIFVIAINKHEYDKV